MKSPPFFGLYVPYEEYCDDVPGDDIRDLMFPPRLAAQCRANGLPMDKSLSSFVAARRGGNESMAQFLTLEIVNIAPGKVI